MEIIKYKGIPIRFTHNQYDLVLTNNKLEIITQLIDKLLEIGVQINQSK